LWLAYFPSGDHGPITVATPDGSNSTTPPLEGHLANTVNADYALSPTGKYLARVYYAAYHGRDQTWLQSVVDGLLWRTMSAYCCDLQISSLVWSPDGHKLAWSLTLPGSVSVTPYQFSISSVTVDPRPEATSDPDSFLGGAAPGIVMHDLSSRAGPPQSPISWSPDGSAFVFAGYPQSIPVTEFPNGAQFAVPTADMAADIYVVRVQDGAEFNITQSAASETNPEWAPDGSSIAFLQSDGSSTRVVTMAMDGLRATEQPIVGPVAEEFEWAPDAKKLVFVHSDSGSSVALVDALFQSASAELLSTDEPVSSLGWQRLGP